MIRTLFFFVSRFLRGNDKKSPLSSLVRLCFWAIAGGTFFLTLIAAIMHGFQHATYTTLQSIHADLIITGQYNEHLNFDAINKVLRAEFPNVIAAAPRASAFVLLGGIQGEQDQHIVTLQAFEPALEAATTTIQKTICKPNNALLTELMQGNSIVMGTALANSLCLAIGDTITLYYAPNTATATETLIFNKYTVRISGIFATGITEYDAQVVWASSDLFEELFGSYDVTSIGLKLRPNSSATTIAAPLTNRLGLNVEPWYSLYPALVQALDLEHQALLIILFLIVALATLTMASTLMLHMEQKKRDIALLRAMGMSMNTVTYLFVTIGLCIASSATLCGMLCGLLASFILNTYKLISLPDAYYITYVPAHLTPSYFLLLFIVANAISLLVVWYTVRKGRMISLSAVIREQT